MKVYILWNSAVAEIVGIYSSMLKARQAVQRIVKKTTSYWELTENAAECDMTVDEYLDYIEVSEFIDDELHLRIELKELDEEPDF